MIDSKLEIKDSVVRILNSLRKFQSLPDKVLKLLSLEDNIMDDDLEVLKMTYINLKGLEVYTDNHIQKLNIILSNSDEELFYEGSNIVLSILEGGSALPDETIEKVISRISNNKFA